MSGAGDRTIAARAAPKPIKLYSTWFCPFAQRAWIALEELGVDYQFIEVELYEGGSHTKRSLPLKEKARRCPPFIACCPRGLVPGLEHGGAGRGATVYESLVVCEYVDEAFGGTGPAGRQHRLLPAEPARRAHVRVWVAFAGERIIPQYYRALMAPDEHARNKAKAALLDGLLELAGAMAPVDAAAGSGAFFLGVEFSLLEVALLPWWQRALVVLKAYRQFSLPVEADFAADPERVSRLRRLKAWGAACAARASYARTVVDEQRLVANNIGYADNTATSNCAQNVRASAGITAGTGGKGVVHLLALSALGGLAATVALLRVLKRR